MYWIYNKTCQTVVTPADLIHEWLSSKQNHIFMQCNPYLRSRRGHEILWRVVGVCVRTGSNVRCKMTHRQSCSPLIGSFATHVSSRFWGELKRADSASRCCSNTRLYKCVWWGLVCVWCGVALTCLHSFMHIYFYSVHMSYLRGCLVKVLHLMFFPVLLGDG